MTDEQIIKALEICKKTTPNGCFECPFVERFGLSACKRVLSSDALDLIKRQKAEIEKLTLENLQIVESVKGLEAKVIKQFAEILKKNEGRSGVPIATIDNLVKKLTEVSDNDRA